MKFAKVMFSHRSVCLQGGLGLCLGGLCLRGLCPGGLRLGGLCLGGLCLGGLCPGSGVYHRDTPIW